MTGKEKCKALKEIRQNIARSNDIAFAVSECTHKGDCKGTCPKCEAELRYLEKELAVRRKLGKAVAVAGVSAGLMTTLTACTPMDVVETIFQMASEIVPEKKGALAGDVAYTVPDDIQGGLEYRPEDPIELEGDVAYTPEEE